VPAGKPNEPELQRNILRSALKAAPLFDERWGIVQLPFQWGLKMATGIGKRSLLENFTGRAWQLSLPTSATIRRAASHCWIKKKNSRSGVIANKALCCLGFGLGANIR